MAVARMNFYSTVEAKASTIPLRDGNLIFVRDKRKILLDTKGDRIEYGSIITLINEEQRLGIAQPLEGFYFVNETFMLWRYSEDSGWKELIGGSNSSSSVVMEDGDTLPDQGKEKVLYVTDSGIFKWKDGAYVTVAMSNPEPLWESI